MLKYIVLKKCKHLLFDIFNVFNNFLNNKEIQFYI